MDPRRTIGLIGWVVVASHCSSAAAQVFDPPWNVSPVGQIGGWCTTVQVVGGYAYVGEWPNLTILDVSDRLSPLPVGHLCFGDYVVQDIQIKDGLAYIAGAALVGDQGLQIVDVTNPCSPRLLASYPAPVWAHGVYVTDGLAYVACGYQGYVWEGGFQIIDVSDPSSPTLRGSFLTAPFFGWQVHVSDGIAYVAGLDGLHIFDVTNPSLPTRLAIYSQNYCNDVFVAGGLAYTATYNGLEIVDVTSPTAPRRRGKLWHGQAYGLFVSDRLVYLAEPDYSGLGIIDVTNASSPTLIGSCRTSGRAQAATVSSDTAYLADWMGGLSIMDVTNPSSPTLRAVYDTLSDPSDVSVAEGVAYVANGVRGLKTIDVSNPRSPMVLGSLALPGVAAKITLSGKTAYVCDRSGTTPEEPRFLHIVDITTPSSPRLLSSYAVPRAWNGAVSGGLAYVTHNDGFQIIDVSNPSSPTLRGSFGTPGWPMDVAVSGELAFVADYTSLQIVDVSDPTSPFLRSSFEDGFRINEVFVSYGIAYITGTWAGGDFACLDVKNPDNPRLLGMYNVPGLSGEAEGLSVSKGFAYFLFAHLRILDVRDPSAPTLCGFYPTGGASGFPSDVFAYGDLVYLADLSGLRIFQYTGGAMGANHWPLYR